MFNIKYFFLVVNNEKLNWGKCELLSVRHEKSAGSGVGMNSYAILFHKTCVHPCIHYLYAQRTALLKYNVFGIGIDGEHG
jgi:hypothetical protein